MSANTITMQNELNLGLQLSTLKNQIDYYHALQVENTTILADVLEHINIFMKNTIDSKTMESWEKVIGVIDEFADARATYNLELAKFFNTCSDDDFSKFMCQVAGFSNSKIQEKLKIAGSVLSLKQFVRKGCLKDGLLYLDIKKLIATKPHNQELIDELHYVFYSSYKLRENIDKSVSRNKHSKEFLEPVFLKECYDLLLPFISRVELDLVKDTNFVIIENCTEDGSYLWGAILKFSEELDDLLSKTMKLTQEKVRFNGLVASDINCLLEALLRAREIGYDKNYFLAYRVIHDSWYDSLAAREKIEQEFRSLTKKYKSKKKNVQETLPLEEKTIATVIPSVRVEEREQVASVVDIESKKEEVEDLHQFKTEQFKASVMKQRAEKEALKAHKKEQENKYFQERKEATAKLSAQAIEKKRETGFNLFKSLAPKRQNLVELMFQEPTPHNQIRYEDIESLFGTADEGKIPGSITAVGGGSHRKICIQNTIGFFDKYLINENNSESSSSTGGVFKPHGNQHTGSRVPRVVVEMVRAILEKVGITAETIASFRNDYRLKNS